MMRIQIKNCVTALLIIGGTSAFLGCAATPAPITNTKVQTVFDVPKRQLAPEPTYNRMRWVHLPAVMPMASRLNANDRKSNARASLDQPMIFPIIHFELKEGTLMEASEMLGASTRYHSSVDSSIADKTISLDMLGTVHELANKISEIANIEVVIDHVGREIRFVPRGANDGARFYDNTVSTYEHR